MERVPSSADAGAAKAIGTSQWPDAGNTCVWLFAYLHKSYADSGLTISYFRGTKATCGRDHGKTVECKGARKISVVPQN
jgi:hypothetical protein